MSFATAMDNDTCIYTDTDWDHVGAWKAVQALFIRRDSVLRLLNRVEERLYQNGSQFPITRTTEAFWEAEYNCCNERAVSAKDAYYARCSAENMHSSCVTRDTSGHIISYEVWNV